MSLLIYFLKKEFLDKYIYISFFKLSINVASLK
jgi:hypothetical protein